MKEPLNLTLTLEVSDGSWKFRVDPGFPDNDLWPDVLKHVGLLTKAVRDAYQKGPKSQTRILGEAQGDLAK